MTTVFRQETAQIYQFPRKARTASSERREAGRTAADLITQRNPDIDFGSSWYHQAAVREADQATKL